MSRGVLGFLPRPAPAEERDDEERRPEDQVGERQHGEAPHPGQARPHLTS